MSTAMNPEPAMQPGALSLDHLIALNDEITALVRAGVPLERGLLDVSGDVGGPLGAIASTLGERMSRGESLTQALDAESARFPRVYRAVVEAGIRAGRLPVALEGLAGYARGYADLRRAVGLALLYPLIVLTLAYGLFLGFALRIGPKLLSAFGGLGVPVKTPATWISRLNGSVAYWGPVLPALLVVCAFWWAWSGRAASLQGAWAAGPFGWFPWMRRMLRNARAANFADLLALLLEHDVPLPDAVALSADATGDAALRRAAAEVAEAARRGEPLHVATRAREVPPLMRWMLTSGEHSRSIAHGLRHAGDIYRRRAMHQVELVRGLLPIVLTVLIGGTATIVYALSLFWPFSNLLWNLSTE